MDFNDHRKDSEIGSASFDMSKLREDASYEGLEAPILKDGKDKGMIRYDVTFYPVLKSSGDTGGKEELPEDTSEWFLRHVRDTMTEVRAEVGIVRLTMHQAKDLDHTKSMSGDLNPFCRVHLGTDPHPIFTTNKMKHTNNPVWETSTEWLCTDRPGSVVTIKIVDDREFLKDPIIGYMSVRVEDLLNANKEAGRDWWELSNCKSGRVRLSADWKPLNMPGSVHGADQYVPPIGVVRLWLQKATDVKCVRAAGLRFIYARGAD